MIQPKTVDDAVVYLNELLMLDRPAIAALIANRVPCNGQLANHPTAQVWVQNGGYHVGMLGIINGLFGLLDGGYWPITYRFDDNGDLAMFTRTDGADQ